ncbi:MAG: flagellar hook-basal body complex protein FliE [Pseudomonadota bacterium]
MPPMTIAAISAVKDIAAQGQSVASAAPSAPAQASFGDHMKAAASNAVAAVEKSEATAMAAMVGEASLQDVTQAVVSAEMTVQTVLAVRNKLIEAYQDIIRMPV